MTKVRFTNPPTYRERMALRLIGVGVVLLSEAPLRNLVRYCGSLWNVGCWTISKYPITEVAHVE